MFEKKIITGNVYFASIRKRIIKELCGIYKVFLLLNECGVPHCLFQGNPSVGKVWLKIYVQFYFGGMTLSGLLAHWAREVLYSLAKQKFSLAPGVGLADFLSPV